MRTAPLLLLAAWTTAIIGTAGCTQNNQPKTHPPISPEAVKLYDRAPADEFEPLGTVESTPNVASVTWEQDYSVDPAVDEMKAKAAAMGANGLLLNVAPGQSKPFIQVLGKYRGQYYTFTVRTKPERTGIARAIFVPGG